MLWITKRNLRKHPQWGYLSLGQIGTYPRNTKTWLKSNHTEYERFKKN